ncbi:MAG: hypothetical protein ABFS03_10100 [Chloroflexota bacterium]
MKKLITILLLISALMIAGCSADETVGESTSPEMNATPTPLMAGSFGIDYDDATSARNQLALGTLKLEDGSLGISVDQASTLLPLWQALMALESSETTAPEELTAVQNQIIQSMRDEQISAISAMQFTNSDLTDFYTDQGLVISTPSADSESGSMKDMTPEEREAFRATAEAQGTPVGEGGGGSGKERKDLLTETVIALLTEITNQ